MVSTVQNRKFNKQVGWDVEYCNIALHRLPRSHKVAAPFSLSRAPLVLYSANITATAA